MKYLFAHTRKIWFIYTWAITLIPSTIVNSAKQLTLFNLKREEIQTLFNNGKKNTVLEKVIARDQCGQMTSNLVYKL